VSGRGSSAPAALALGLALSVAPGASGQPAASRSPEVRLAVLSATADASPRPEAVRALRTLGATVARRTSVEAAADEPAVLHPLAPELYSHPLVFLTGEGAFPQWTEPERDALRTYLTLGGMVVLDDSPAEDGGESEFAAGARRELGRVLGGREFGPLSADHSIFRAYYLLERAWGRVDASPDLEAIVLDGRAAVVLSPDDLLGALARDELGQWSRPVQPGGRRQRELSLRLGVNLVLYALTLDYKEDLVHLPHILERRR
jgi:hypothetical protein